MSGAAKVMDRFVAYDLLKNANIAAGGVLPILRGRFDRGFAIRDHSLYLYADCLKPDCPNRPKGE